MLLTVSSFLIVTALVAYVSWLRTKNDDLTTSKGYFLAGRGLSGIVIGCSMVLTSLSTEQLIGVNAVSYQLFYYCVDSTNGDSALFLGALYVAEIFA